MTSIIPEIDPRHPAQADPAKIVQAIQQEKVTNSFGSPTLWRKVAAYCNEKKIQLPTMKRVLCAGAPVPSDLWSAADSFLPAGKLHSPYGATEALPVSSRLGRRDRRRHPRRGACVGFPVAGIDVRIIPITDKPVTADSSSFLPAGAIGEIIVRGPVVTREYHSLPKATAAAKIPDSERPGGVWHRMGDCGHMDSAGRLWFLGRKVERVQTPEGTLYTEPCEQVFRAHPLARRCALISAHSVCLRSSSRRPRRARGRDEDRGGARPHSARATSTRRASRPSISWASCRSMCATMRRSTGSPSQNGPSRPRPTRCRDGAGRNPAVRGSGPCHRGHGFPRGRLWDRLLAQGRTVSVLARKPAPDLEARGVRFVQRLTRGGRRAAVAEACAGWKPSSMWRRALGCGAAYNDFFRANVLGTRAVIRDAEATGVRRLIYTSTPSVVYNGRDLAGADESLPLDQGMSQPYPLTKAIAGGRGACGQWSADFRTVALRPHLIWGPGDPHLVPRILARARAGRLRIVGEGRNRVDMVHVENAADAHIAAESALALGIGAPAAPISSRTESRLSFGTGSTPPGGAWAKSP
jgi:nucleoside-diphosphate-sugar epimerase